MLFPTIFAPGAGGVPSTSLLADLRGRLDSIEGTATATGGFETCTITLRCSRAEGLDWLNQLMASVIVYDRDGLTAFEGYLNSAEFSAGQERRSRSLDGMANRVRCRYTTVNDVPGVTAAISDTTSIARYGTKDAVIGLGKVTPTEAANYAAAYLAEHKEPKANPTSTASTGAGGEVALTLGFVGWYYALDRVLTSRTDTSNEVTTTQVGALIGTASPGIGAVNPFLSTSTTNIVTSGIQASRKIDPDTPYRSKIEALLIQGNGVNRYAWGVYEDRIFYADVWRGAAPDTAQYLRFLGDGRIYDATNQGVVMPWRVRPNTMIFMPELLDLNPLGADAAARFFIERVTWRMDQSSISVDLEPAASTSADARLAYLGRNG
jgi:hypothetical protein